MANIPIGADSARVTTIRLPSGTLSPFGPSVALDRAVIASALAANPNAGEALAMAVAVIQCFRENRQAIESFASLVNDLTDAIDGDPDFEDNGEDHQTDDAEDDFAFTSRADAFADRSGPGCYVGDPGDISSTEWHTRGRFKLSPGIYGKDGWTVREDDELSDWPEDDDPIEDDDPSGQCDEDGMNCGTGRMTDLGPGCPLADNDSGQPMQDDVPMLPVYSAEHNIFTDQRTPLGISNLQSSYRTNGGEVRSADTGAVLVTKHKLDDRTPPWTYLPPLRRGLLLPDLHQTVTSRLRAALSAAIPAQGRTPPSPAPASAGVFFEQRNDGECKEPWSSQGSGIVHLGRASPPSEQLANVGRAYFVPGISLNSADSCDRVRAELHVHRAGPRARHNGS